MWIHLLEFAYNSTIHLSTGTTPFHVLLGFHPQTPLDFMGTKHSDDIDDHALGPEVITFLENFAMHRFSKYVKSISFGIIL